MTFTSCLCFLFTSLVYQHMISWWNPLLVIVLQSLLGIRTTLPVFLRWPDDIELQPICFWIHQLMLPRWALLPDNHFRFLIGIDIAENVFLRRANVILMTLPCHSFSHLLQCRLSQWNLISIHHDIYPIVYRGSFFLHYLISWWFQKIHFAFSLVGVSHTDNLLLCAWLCLSYRVSV